MRILAVRPGLASDRAVCYTCFQLCAAMRAAGADTYAYVPTSDMSVRYPFVRRILPPRARRMYRFGWFSLWLDAYLEYVYGGTLRDRDIAYLWPGVSVELARRIKEKTCARIVIENINCHQGLAKHILEIAYARLGWPVVNTISDDDISRENEKLAYADAVFAANPLSAASLRENGVPEDKILVSTYGWDPGRFAAGGSPLPGLTHPVFFSAGFVCVRKGSPIAMRTWDKAGIDGTLLFVGHVFDDVRERCASSLNSPSVKHYEYQNDLGPYYYSADVFFFLTLEEGGPMVTIEAMGCGLPVITTPMGAGEICRDGIEGFIVDPFDEDMVIDRMRKLATDEGLRRSMGMAARKRAMDYTWSKVGARRLGLLQKRFST